MKSFKSGKVSQLHKFIINLPYGYETIIGKGSFLAVLETKTDMQDLFIEKMK